MTYITLQPDVWQLLIMNHSLLQSVKLVVSVGFGYVQKLH